MQFPAPRSRNARGVTIIDTLVAMLLVIGAITGLIGVVPYSFSQIEYDSIAVQAAAAGQQFLDQIRYDELNGYTVPASTTVAIDFGKTFAGGQSTGLSGNFTLTSSCSALNGSLLTEDCTVTVTWTENGASRQTELESYITGTSY